MDSFGMEFIKTLHYFWNRTKAQVPQYPNWVKQLYFDELGAYYLFHKGMKLKSIW